MRGQSAVEYLVTYGWAILALAIVMGVLLSSGILSPSYLMSEECSAGTNFPCSFALYNSGEDSMLSLRLYNSFPYAVEIREVTVTYPDTGDVFAMEPASAFMLESGQRQDLSGAFLGLQFPENSYRRLVMTIEYASCAPELLLPGETCSASVHTISGKVSGRVLGEES